MKRPNITPGPWKMINLYGANLRSANLYGADLSGTNLSGADLRSADLRSADLSGVSDPETASCFRREAANKRIQALAKLALKEAGYTFD